MKFGFAHFLQLCCTQLLKLFMHVNRILVPIALQIPPQAPAQMRFTGFGKAMQPVIQKTVQPICVPNACSLHWLNASWQEFLQSQSDEESP